MTQDTKEQLVSKFKHCAACNNLFLINRKGYLCSTGSAACNMGVFPDSKNNYIDLRDDEDFSQKLDDFVKRPRKGDYMDACKYCTGLHCVQFEEKVPVAVQAKELLKFPPLMEENDGRG